MEQAKAAAYTAYLRNPDPKFEQAWAKAAHQLFIHSTLYGATLAEKFDEALKLNPAHTRRLIASQRADETDARQHTAIVVAVLALNAGAVS